MNLQEMKRLHEKSEALLTLAEGMQRKINRMEKYNENTDSFMYSPYTDDELDTCKRGLKRLIYSYKKILIQIAEL